MNHMSYYKTLLFHATHLHFSNFLIKDQISYFESFHFPQIQTSHHVFSSPESEIETACMTRKIPCSPFPILSTLHGNKYDSYLNHHRETFKKDLSHHKLFLF